MLILSTCSICNTFSIDFLSAGVAAIAGICTFGCEFFTAALADQILTAHLAVFPLPPIVGLIAAPVAVTVFLGVDGGVEHPTVAAADKFADGVSSGVFRLSFSGSSPGIPCRRSCGFQGAVLDLAIKIATQQPEPDHPFRDGLGSGSLCSDQKVKNLLRLLWEPSWNSK